MKKLLIVILLMAVLLSGCGFYSVENTEPQTSYSGTDTQSVAVSPEDTLLSCEGSTSTEPAESSKTPSAITSESSKDTEPVKTEVSTSTQSATESSSSSQKESSHEEDTPDTVIPEETTTVTTTQQTTKETTSASTTQQTTTQNIPSEPTSTTKETEPVLTETTAFTASDPETSAVLSETKTSESVPSVPDTSASETTSNRVPAIKPPCKEHTYEYSHTTIDVPYEFYDLVTDYSKCADCGAISGNTHRAPKEVSADTIFAAEQVIIACVNQLRESQGLNRLEPTSEWNAWAKVRAEEQAICYGHSRPDGSSWTNAIGNYYTAAENVAAGQPSGYDFYNAFYNSASHKAAMLTPNAVHIGVAVYVSEEGVSYCAMILVAGF